VNASQIPGAPGGLNVQAQGGTITLNWSPAAGAVSGYAIYRIIGLVNSSQQFLAMSQSTSYTDSSAASEVPSGYDEIFYYVYAVGPTGVENPQDAFGSILTS
jgi:hypothetical protein